MAGKSDMRGRFLAGLILPAQVLPREIAEWYGAMLREAEQAKSAMEFLDWVSGAFTATVALTIRHSLAVSVKKRSAAVMLVVAYFVGFSAVVCVRLALEVLAWHVPQLWGSVWLSILRCSLLAFMAVLIASALWGRHRYGPLLAILFAFVHCLGVLIGSSVVKVDAGQLATVCVNTAIVLAMFRHCTQDAIQHRENG